MWRHRAVLPLSRKRPQSQEQALIKGKLMRDPFADLFSMHETASVYGCALNAELLEHIEQRSQRLAQIHMQPNVVPLGSVSSQAGPPQQVSDTQVAADEKLVRFSSGQARDIRRSRNTV